MTAQMRISVKMPVTITPTESVEFKFELILFSTRTTFPRGGMLSLVCMR